MNNEKEREQKRRKGIRRVEKLTKTQSESLARKPLEIARKVFENLAEWRNKSLSSNIRL
jgi:hypothetical protein